MTQHCTHDFGPGEFLVRGECGGWTPLWEFAYKGANFWVFAAYLSIASILVYAYFDSMRKERAMEQISIRERQIIRGVYASFILACGLGHLEGPLSFYWPEYRVFAAWHTFTALVSWAAVAVTARYRAKLIVGL